MFTQLLIKLCVLRTLNIPVISDLENFITTEGKGMGGLSSKVTLLKKLL